MSSQLNELKQRKAESPAVPPQDVVTSTEAHSSSTEPHPAGRIKHSGPIQLLRMLIFATWFQGCCICIVATQFLGSWLYFVNKNYFYAYMSLTKQSFGICVVTITQWFSPTRVRVSGDKSVRGQLGRSGDGRLVLDFPERLIMMANHQLYTDWIYLWWAAYANRMHGHLFILLKESLKYIPVIGQGMMFYGFIFMKRKWASDEAAIKHRLDKLKAQHSGPMSGSRGYDPMWLLIFPEGTNLAAGSRQKSKKWADSQSMADLKHSLLPRSTGLLFCLKQLRGTVDWVYDCTVAYEGVPKGKFAPDYFTLRSTYFGGRPPKSVNMHWQRFAISDMPLDDTKAFEEWLFRRWEEKDDLLEQYYNTGRFPADDEHASDGEPGGDAVMGAGYIETEVRLGHWYEIGQIFIWLTAAAMVANVVAKMWNLLFYGNFKGLG